MATTRPRLRKREIALAVGAGLLAAGGAAAVLDLGSDQRYVAAPSRAGTGADEATFQLTGFDQIVSVGPHEIVVMQGEPFLVRAEGPASSIDRLELTVEGGQLIVSPGEDWFGNWGELDTTTLFVTMPVLDRVVLAGSGEVEIGSLTGQRFEAEIGGSGEISVAALEVEEAVFGIYGSGEIAVAGAARHTEVTIGGSGEVDADELRSETADISIGGSGDVELRVSEDARITVAGGGDVSIEGPATCSVSRMGGGDVECEGSLLEQ